MGIRRLFQSQGDGFHFNVADGFNSLSGYTSKDLHLQERNKFCQSVLETFEWFSIVPVKLKRIRWWFGLLQGYSCHQSSISRRIHCIIWLKMFTMESSELFYLSLNFCCFENPIYYLNTKEKYSIIVTIVIGDFKTWHFIR